MDIGKSPRLETPIDIPLTTAAAEDNMQSAAISDAFSANMVENTAMMFILKKLAAKVPRAISPNRSGSTLLSANPIVSKRKASHARTCPDGTSNNRHFTPRITNSERTVKITSISGAGLTWANISASAEKSTLRLASQSNTALMAKPAAIETLFFMLFMLQYIW